MLRAERLDALRGRSRVTRVSGMRSAAQANFDL